jgi:tRNA (guanine-N7-)-methyltransferase
VFPVALEIGCGKGGFICGMSRRHPDTVFIGLERAEKVMSSAARKARLTQSRVLLIQDDAAKLTDFFADGELSNIYINFCDPWAGRKKWRKRRLTHRDFLTVYAKLLIDGGTVALKTDDRELFDFSVDEFTEMGWEMIAVDYDLHKDGNPEWNIMTEYEKRKTLTGPIHRLEAVCRRR